VIIALFHGLITYWEKGICADRYKCDYTAVSKHISTNFHL